MPRRLNEGEVRDLFIKAGFIPDNDFRYTNSKRKYRVFDILHNKWVSFLGPGIWPRSDFECLYDRQNVLSSTVIQISNNLWGLTAG